MHPELNAILMTPICPFNLNARPLILPGHAEMEVYLYKDSRALGAVVFDGNIEYTMQHDDHIKVSTSADKIQRIVEDGYESDWLQRLGKKLGWMKTITD